MSEDGWKPDPYVLARLVDTLSRNGPMKRTNLQMSARLNYSALTRYVDWMSQHSLVGINEDEGSQMVVLTQKGKDAQEAFVKWLAKVFDSYTF
ncbi:MAG TPA: winged helix-turn-helix domain-containing protein [Conexivisphaerales archaeon]|nr:winged helix-turn-helix domain-containing protein [Conexivisphaerales archaeon]